MEQMELSLFGKRCLRCECVVEFDNFYTCVNSKDGYRDYCIPCTKLFKKEWRRNNMAQKQDLFDSYAASDYKYCPECDEHKSVLLFSFRWDTKDALQSRCKECLDQAKKDWVEDNREEFNKKNREKINSNPILKLKQSQGRRLAEIVKNLKNGKSGPTSKYFGCTDQEFKEYFEPLFQDGMSWDNHGEWHFDHIKPCAAFNLELESERYECFGYKNLQPLWAKDNIAKGSFYDGERHYYKK